MWWVRLHLGRARPESVNVELAGGAARGVGDTLTSPFHVASLQSRLDHRSTYDSVEFQTHGGAR